MSNGTVPGGTDESACLTRPTSVLCPLTGSLIYEKLGERAFGWPGKIAAFGSIIMQNIGGGWITVMTLSHVTREHLTLDRSLSCPLSHVQLPVHRQVRAA